MFISQLALKGALFNSEIFCVNPFVGETGAALHRNVSVAIESLVPPCIALYDCSSAFTFQVHWNIQSWAKIIIVLLREMRAQGITSWFKAELGPEPRSAVSQANALLT